MNDPKPKRRPEEIAEGIYRAYPRHEAKGDALRAIGKALRRASEGELLEAASAYKAATDAWSAEDRAFIPLPASWFNGSRWLDDRANWRRVKAGRASIASGGIKAEGSFLSGKDDSDAI